MYTFTLLTIFSVIFIHWVFDFFLQSDKIATGKSKSNSILTQHVLIYSVGLVCIGALCFPASTAFVAFVFANAILHFFTDYVTSRASSLLYKDGNTHDFFVVVGADQMIHYFTLFSTIKYFSSWA